MLLVTFVGSCVDHLYILLWERKLFYDLYTYDTGSSGFGSVRSYEGKHVISVHVLINILEISIIGV